MKLVILGWDKANYMTFKKFKDYLQHGHTRLVFQQPVFNDLWKRLTASGSSSPSDQTIEIARNGIFFFSPIPGEPVLDGEAIYLKRTGISVDGKIYVVLGPADDDLRGNILLDIENKIRVVWSTPEGFYEKLFNADNVECFLHGKHHYCYRKLGETILGPDGAICGAANDIQNTGPSCPACRESYILATTHRKGCLIPLKELEATMISWMKNDMYTGFPEHDTPFHRTVYSGVLDTPSLGKVVLGTVLSSIGHMSTDWMIMPVMDTEHEDLKIYQLYIPTYVNYGEDTLRDVTLSVKIQDRNKSKTGEKLIDILITQKKIGSVPYQSRYLTS